MKRSPIESPPSEPEPERRVLKANAKRTVERQVLPDGTAHLVKRFHAPGLGRLRDRRRARSEAAALVEARRRGLPVPAVVSVRREAGEWVLRLTWIEGARPLADVVEHGPTPEGRGRLARRVGELLAAAEASGLRHPDPHAGNVLVDRGGALWLVDLARARFAAHDPRRFERSLVLAAARIRDLCDARFRAVIHRSLREARTSSAPLPPAGTIEARSRDLQREDVAGRVRVWRRDSTATEVVAGPPRTVRQRGLVAPPPEGWSTVRLDGSPAEAAEVWSTLVRATIHRLPAAVPRAVSLEAPHFVEADVPGSAGATTSPEAAAALRLQLAERGLTLVGDPLRAPDGAAIIGPSNRLVRLEGE